GRCAGRDRLAARAHAPRHRRIAGEVQALFDRQHRRKRNQIDVPAAVHLLLAPHRGAVHLHSLQARDAWAAQRTRHPQPDLETARICGFVAEEDEVERSRRGFVRANRTDNRSRRRLRVPLAAIGLDVNGAVDADRHSVTELLDGLRRAERQHNRPAAIAFDQPDRLFDPALFVGADREAEVAGLEGHRVRGKHHLAAGERHALDANKNLHDRMRVFSGSNRGVEPTTATVTGKRSPMYCTASCSPSTARSGGRYDMRMCLPTDGPAPALATYDRRARGSDTGPPPARTR